jgi:3-oxoacyl-[acyl-carrier-protein] synthase III
VANRFDDLDLLLHSGQTDDIRIPGDLPIALEKVELKRDIEYVSISSGCSGFVDLLNMASNWNVKKVGIICVERYSAIIGNRDRMNQSIFSDAACFVEVFPKQIKRIASYSFFVPKKGLSISCDPTKNSEQPIEYSKGSWRFNSDFRMDGPDVYKFVMSTVKRHLLKVVKSHDIDLVLLHQANNMMLEDIKSAVHDYNEKILVPISVSQGNSVSISIPKLISDLNLKLSGKTVLYCGFGVGLKVSTLIIKHY